MLGFEPSPGVGSGVGSGSGVGTGDVGWQATANAIAATTKMRKKSFIMETILLTI